MKHALNVTRLAGLLENLHQLTHLQISLHDISGEELYSAWSRSAFCDLICSIPQGYQRCFACDRRSIASLTPPYAPLQYRCHAGLIDAVIPITEGGQLVATILFGQLLDDSPREAQWALTRQLCAWYPDQPTLETAFTKLAQLSNRQIKACYEIINACVSEIRLEGLMKRSAQTDAERLDRYIGEHYAQPLTVSLLAQALSCSKNKLYLLAEQLEPGLTISGLIAKRRIAAAQQLLARPGATVRDVAERVGIPDYNYFAKVFRKATGMTPSAYRARGRSINA